MVGNVVFTGRVTDAFFTYSVGTLIDGSTGTSISDAFVLVGMFLMLQTSRIHLLTFTLSCDMSIGAVSCIFSAVLLGSVTKGSVSNSAKCMRS